MAMPGPRPDDLYNIDKQFGHPMMYDQQLIQYQEVQDAEVDGDDKSLHISNDDAASPSKHGFDSTGNFGFQSSKFGLRQSSHDDTSQSQTNEYRQSSILSVS